MAVARPRRYAAVRAANPETRAMTVMTRPTRALSFDPATLPGDLVIGAERRTGAARIDVVDPSTGKPFATVADGTVEDALAAVAAAHAAGPAWAATAPRARSEILRRAYELMIERRAMLAELISLENGKALPDATGEVTYAAEFFRWFSEEAVRLNGELAVAPGGANRILVQYQPIGVAVMVTPWNFPAAMATRKLGPALAAGCTCVLKPAGETPFTAYVLADILAEAGLPAGVVNVVTTSKLRRRRSAPCSTTPGCASSPSPARPRSAGGCSRRPPTR